MSNYIIYFNQQWVGDHPAEWYVPRGPLSRAVVVEMKEAGVLVFAGGLEKADLDSARPTFSNQSLLIGDYNL
jgi:hypothetical protein